MANDNKFNDLYNQMDNSSKKYIFKRHNEDISLMDYYGITENDDFDDIDEKVDIADRKEKIVVIKKILKDMRLKEKKENRKKLMKESLAYLATAGFILFGLPQLFSTLDEYNPDGTKVERIKTYTLVSYDENKYILETNTYNLAMEDENDNFILTNSQDEQVVVDKNNIEVLGEFESYEEAVEAEENPDFDYNGLYTQHIFMHM